MAGAPASSRARWAAGAAAALAYAAVSHALMTRAADSPWSLAIILGPAVVLGAAWAWSTGHRLPAAAGVLLVLLLVLQGAIGKVIPSRWLYLAQHAGVHLALAVGFGATLRPGAEPLITSLARRVHGSLSPAMERYTRQVTAAWTLYFVAMAAASVLLFAAGEFAHWSLLANILTPVFTAGFFVGEYLVRYWLHPDFERVSLQQALHAYRSHGVPARGAPQDASHP